MKKRVIKIIFFIIALISVLLILFFLIRYKGEKSLQKSLSEEKTEDVKENNVEWEEFQHTLEYNGKTYQYRKNIINILCIGVDKEEVMSERDDDGGSVGQSDAVLLVSLDLDKSDIRIFAIPRDTMVNIVACDENGNEMGAFKGQLALQYAYADGQEKSCKLVAQQVLDIFKNQIQLNGYVAMNLSCISAVNDAVGGVTVWMDDDYTLYNPKFEKGATVHLQGEEAQEYVQGRDIRVSGSALTRIVRQKQYLTAFIEQMKKALKKNPVLTVTLMKELSDNMITDISADEVVYLTTEVLNCNFNEKNMQSLKGEIQMENEYEEYYLDETALQQTILDYFYEEQ